MPQAIAAALRADHIAVTATAMTTDPGLCAVRRDLPACAAQTRLSLDRDTQQRREQLTYLMAGAFQEQGRRLAASIQTSHPRFDSNPNINPNPNPNPYPNPYVDPNPFCPRRNRLRLLQFGPDLPGQPQLLRPRHVLQRTL